MKHLTPFTHSRKRIVKGSPFSNSITLRCLGQGITHEDTPAPRPLSAFLLLSTLLIILWVMHPSASSIASRGKRCTHSYSVERRIGPAGSAWKKIASRSPGRAGAGHAGTGSGRGALRCVPPSLNAVDTPMRTVPVDALEKVAARGLPLGYR